MKEIIVIGGGLTGLVAGLECIKNGYNVTIFEKRNKIGGKMGKDNLGLYLFPKKIFLPNNIDSKLYYEDLVDVKVITSYITSNHIILNLYCDRLKFRDELLKYSINDEEAISSLLDDIDIASSFYLSSLELSNVFYFKLSREIRKSIKNTKYIYKKYSNISTDEYLSRFNSEVIRKALSLVVGKNCAASSLIITLASFINHSVYYIKDDIITRVGCEFIKDGGKISSDKMIDELIFDRQNHISSVKLSDNTTVSADYFISTIDPYHLYNKLIKKRGYYKFSIIYTCYNDYLNYPMNTFMFVVFKIDKDISYNCIDIQINENLVFTKYINTIRYEKSIIDESIIFASIPININDLDYISILKTKNDHYKSTINIYIDLVLNSFKNVFKDTKCNFINLILPSDIEKEYDSYRGFTTGFCQMPKYPRLKEDGLIKGINNLINASPLIYSIGGITESMIVGKNAAKKVEKMVNEKKK